MNKAYSVLCVSKYLDSYNQLSCNETMKQQASFSPE